MSSVRYSFIRFGIPFIYSMLRLLFQRYLLPRAQRIFSQSLVIQLKNVENQIQRHKVPKHHALSPFIFLVFSICVSIFLSRRRQTLCVSSCRQKHNVASLCGIVSCLVVKQYAVGGRGKVKNFVLLCAVWRIRSL